MFRDRQDAGRRLAEALQAAGVQVDVVLGIPRGGVVVARPVADRLKCALDVVMARKVGSPRNPEFAIGAVTPDGEVFMDERLAEYLGVNRDSIEAQARHVKAEIERRLRLYRAGHPGQDLAGKRVLVVDDGIATGSTVRAAVEYLRRQGATYIAVAVPVASKDARRLLLPTVDDFFALLVPEDFYAVGQFYHDFAPAEDEDVVALLRTVQHQEESVRPQ